MSCALFFVDEPQVRPISTNGNMSAIVVNGNHLSVFDVETLTQLHHRQLLQNDDCFMCEWNGLSHVLTLV